jgi:hypothetical protein
LKTSIRLTSILILLISFQVSAKPKRGVGKNFFKYISKIENPFLLRDPFKSPLRKQTVKKRKTKGTGYREGNALVSGSRVLWSAISLSELDIVGVIVGENRRAMAKVSGNDKIQVLKEGMEIGPDRAILKAVLPSGVIFVEKIVNVYGQEEYLETVIPISR